MKIIRDDIDKFFDYGLDLQTRTLYIGSAGATEFEGEPYETGMDYLMAQYAISGLHILDKKGRGNITIIQNNLGGDEYHGLGIYDAIKCCENWVTMRVFGMAASMGSWILQAADERLMAPHATCMIHNGSWGGWDRGEFLKDAMREYDRLNDMMYAHYLERIREKHPRFKLEKLKQMLDRKDVYMSAKQTVALGLADNIIEYPEHSK